MIRLIVGTKGSGKTKAMIDMINESVPHQQKAASSWWKRA